MNCAAFEANDPAAAFLSSAAASANARWPARLVNRYGSVIAGVLPDRNAAISARGFSRQRSSPVSAANLSDPDHAKAGM